MKEEEEEDWEGMAIDGDGGDRFVVAADDVCLGLWFVRRLIQLLR